MKEVVSREMQELEREAVRIADLIDADSATIKLRVYPNPDGVLGRDVDLELEPRRVAQVLVVESVNFERVVPVPEEPHSPESFRMRGAANPACYGHPHGRRTGMLCARAAPMALTVRTAHSPAATIARTLVLPVLVPRSEEHTSELQSQSNLVCRLLLEKKNTQTYIRQSTDKSNSTWPRFLLSR